jgi:hypothetical protein
VEEGLGHTLGDGDVEIVAPEEGVARGREHLEDVAREVEQRAIEGAAAEVVDGDALLGRATQAIGERGGRGLVDDAEDVEPGDTPATLVAARCSSLKFAGTVMTARSTDSPRARSASSLARRRTNALISGSVYSCPRATTRGPCPGPSFSSKAKRWRPRRISSDPQARPMRRLMLAMVFLASTTRRSFAGKPTRTSPFGWNDTTLGSSRRPCSSGRT